RAPPTSPPFPYTTLFRSISPDGYCESCGRKVRSGRDHQETDLGIVAGVTDRGLRHHRNEDAMALGTADTAAGPAVVAVVCDGVRSEEHTSELQSRFDLVC